jgi:hypothetical protein
VQDRDERGLGNIQSCSIQRVHDVVRRASYRLDWRGFGGGRAIVINYDEGRNRLHLIFFRAALKSSDGTGGLGFVLCGHRCKKIFVAVSRWAE